MPCTRAHWPPSGSLIAAGSAKSRTPGIVPKLRVLLHQDHDVLDVPERTAGRVLEGGRQRPVQLAAAAAGHVEGGQHAAGGG
jgi:hypothetical protein